MIDADVDSAVASVHLSTERSTVLGRRWEETAGYYQQHLPLAIIPAGVIAVLELRMSARTEPALLRQTNGRRRMCNLYAQADPILYESRSRSVRVGGVVTSIRLENMVWDVIAEIAQRNDMTTNQMISKLYEEIIEARGEVPNFASFLRVSCLRYLRLQIEQGEGAVDERRVAPFGTGSTSIQRVK